MPKYLLDTNLYIRAARDAAANAELRRFYAANTPFLHLHSVVAGELLAGAVSPEVARQTRERIIQPFERVRRVVTPTHRAWCDAGAMLASLVRLGKIRPASLRSSFFNDCLIAASAALEGMVVVTENLRDFELLRSVSAVEYSAPWPA